MTDILHKLLPASLALVAGAGWAHDGREPIRFQATLQATSTFVQAPEGGTPPKGCEVSRGEQPAIGVLKVVGAGTTNLFVSPVYVEQQHCVRADGTFFAGCFKLTKTPLPLAAAPCSSSHPLVDGRYFGRLVPTFNSRFPPPAPLGVWLIAGNVCIVSVRGRAVSDCAQPPRHYEPASGITDLNTGAATVFLDQVIEFRQGK
ncbi:MAG: hypothetical protein U1E63_01435 [Burkholderiales bacterium]